jgi:hypothetical protein
MGDLYQTDPLLRLIPREGFPLAFYTLPDEEQRWRGRVYLMLYSLTGHASHAWWLAMNTDADSVRNLKELVRTTPDSSIMEELRRLSAEQQEAVSG